MTAQGVQKKHDQQVKHDKQTKNKVSQNKSPLFNSHAGVDWPKRDGRIAKRRLKRDKRAVRVDDRRDGTAHGAAAGGRHEHELVERHVEQVHVGFAVGVGKQQGRGRLEDNDRAVKGERRRGRGTRGVDRDGVRADRPRNGVEGGVDDEGKGVCECFSVGERDRRKGKGEKWRT